MTNSNDGDRSELLHRITQRLDDLDQGWPVLLRFAAAFRAVVAEDNRASNVALRGQGVDLQSVARDVLALAEDVITYADLGIEEEDWNP